MRINNVKVGAGSVKPGGDADTITMMGKGRYAIRQFYRVQWKGDEFDNGLLRDLLFQ